MLVFVTALPFLISVCPGVVSLFWKFLCLLWRVFEALHIPLFIATEHPTCSALVSVPLATYTLATYTLVTTQQVCVVTEVKQLFSNLITQLESDFFRPWWQTDSLKPSNWLLWDLLRRNMLPGG